MGLHFGKEKDWYDSQSFSFILLHNLIFIDAGEECDAGLFQMDLPGAINVTHGEDFSFKSFSLPVHSAGSVFLDDTKVCGRCSVIFLIVRLLWMIKPQTCQKKTGFAD